MKYNCLHPSYKTEWKTITIKKGAIKYAKKLKLCLIIEFEKDFRGLLIDLYKTNKQAKNPNNKYIIGVVIENHVGIYHQHSSVDLIDSPFNKTNPSHLKRDMFWNAKTKFFNGSIHKYGQVIYKERLDAIIKININLIWKIFWSDIIESITKAKIINAGIITPIILKLINNPTQQPNLIKLRIFFLSNALTV